LELQKGITAKRLDGIHYQSRPGSEIENWAIFHVRAIILPANSITVSGDDQDFRQASMLLNVTAARTATIQSGD
jgi:hypothetical protein